MENVWKIGVGLLAFLFTINGLVMMFAPETGMSNLGLTVADMDDAALGLNTVRGDLGGFFLGGAILAIWGILKNPTYLMALAIVISVVMLGRIIGIATDGFAFTSLLFFIIEGVIVGVLVLAHKDAVQ